MTRTPNLIPLFSDLSALDANDSLVPTNGYDSGWRADNATISVVANNQKHITHYALKVVPTGTATVSLYLDDVELVDIFNEHTIQFHSLVKSSTDRLTVQSTIFRENESESTHLGIELVSFIDVYGLTKSDLFTSPETAGRKTDTVSLKIVISGHNQQPFYMTYPTLVNNYGWSANNFIQNARAKYIPHFYWDMDQQQDPEYSFYKLLDTLTYSADQTLVKYRDVFPYSLQELPVSADGLEEWANSDLVDPLHVSSEYLEWLSQFSGSTLQKKLSTSNIDIELFKYWQLATRSLGMKSGSTDSIIATAALALCGRVSSIDRSINGRIVAANKPIRSGVSVSSVARYLWQFNYDGTFDHVFDDNQGTGFDDDIYVVKAQDDGKILCGGDFLNVNGASATRIVRLNLDGTSDETFDASATFGSSVNDIAILSDGNIIVGGNFTNGTGRYLKKINSFGSVVSEFNSNISTNINGEVLCIHLQDDNKVLIGGSFTDPANYVGRFNSDGTEDTAFTANAATVLNGQVNDIAVQSDGKIIVVGEFTKPTRYVARLLSTGAEDTDFSQTIGNTIAPVRLATTTGINLASFSSTIDGQALVNGDRVLVKDQELTASITAVAPNTPTSGKVRFTTSAAHGFAEDDYVIITGIAPGQYNQTYEIDAVTSTTFDVVQAYADTPTKVTGSASARREQNGVYVYSGTSFTRATDLNTKAKVLAEPIVAVTEGTSNSGTFWKVTPYSLNFTIDTTFVDIVTSSYFIDDSVSTVAVDGDDKIVLGGAFTEPANHCARLLDDGTVDSRFNSNLSSSFFGSSSANEVTSIVLDDENNVYVAGEFYPEIKKLNSDGTENTAVSTQILKSVVDMRSIAVLPIYQDDPWQIHVLTLARETADTDPASVVTGVAPSSPTSGSVTYTTSSAHGFTAGDTVTIRSLSASGYNGTFEVTSAPTPTTFVVANATTTVSTSTISAVTPSTPSSGSVRYTTSSAHNLSSGDIVVITGLAPSGYNGTFTVTSVTATTFDVVNATTSTVTVSSGTCAAVDDQDGTASRSSEAILELLEYSKPMGYQITHSSENLFEFTLNSVALGKLSKASLG